MEDQDRQRLAAVEQGFVALTARLNALAEGHLELPGEGFRVGSTRLLEKLISGDYHLHQRDALGVESDLTGAKSIWGKPIHDTAPTGGYVLVYNASTKEIEWTASSTPGAHVLATTAALGPAHTVSGLTARQVLRATGATTAAFGAIQGADVPATHSGSAHHAISHKDRHDPQDGADKLDTANAAEISVVVAAGPGVSHSFARADHIHAINHALTDNHLATIDGTTNPPAVNDYAKWTALGLEGKTYAELLADVSGVAASDFKLSIDSTPSNDKCSGMTAELTAGAALTRGDFCYVGADGKMEKALATAEATARVIAVCEEATIAENAAGTFLLHGFFEKEFNFTTVGAKIYLSDDTAGAHDETAPADTDECIVILGIAMAADCLYFNPTVQAIVEHV